MQLQEAIDLFINRPEIAAATRRSYYYDLDGDNKLSDYLGSARPVSDITPADMLRYGQYLDNYAGIISDHTYNKHITSTRALFNFLVKLEVIDKSPAKILKMKIVSQRVPKSKAMPDRLLIRLLEYVAETPRGWEPREEALVRFLADTGCRIGGAASLTTEHLHINERYADLWEKGKPDPHRVRFGRECSHSLSSWLLRRNATNGHYVFSSDGHRMLNGNLAQYFRRLCKRAGIGSWGPHSLRHRKGHKAAEKFPVSIAAKILGDTVEVFLKHYAPQDEAYVERAMLELTTDHLISHNIIKLDKKASSE